MKENNQLYTQKFYESQVNESLESAKEVVPLIIELFSPKSVIDVGCGIGTWSSVFLDQGVQRVQGIDGDYVDSKQLLIPVDNFKPVNLKEAVNLEEKFDLAVSLEVIEHLEDNKGKQLVKSLTELAPIVVFSAAIPGQGGTNHINEQWQSYWANEFDICRYDAYDMVRPLIWGNKKVYVCYKQNIIVYVSREYIAKNPDKDFGQVIKNTFTLDTIHPSSWDSLRVYNTPTMVNTCRYYFLKSKEVVKRFIR